MIKVKKLNGHAIVPQFAHATDSGADLYTCSPLELQPGEKGIAKTGIALALPRGFGATIRNKSGNTVKGVLCEVRNNIAKLSIEDNDINDVIFDWTMERVDITVYLGTIDNAYRGEIGIMVKNESNHVVRIPKGTKLAQLVLEHVYHQQFEVVDELDETDRGEGGFGSTGTH